MKNATILLIILALTPAHASASYIQLIPSLSINDIVSEDTVTIPATIVNNGDESAYNVQMTLLLPDGFTSKNIFMREIKPGEKKEGVFTLEIPADTPPGTYVLALLTHYADANEYPLSSINSAILNYKTSTSSAVTGYMGTTELGREPVTLNITLRNREEKPHDITLKLLLPDELQTNQITTKATIEPNQEQQIQATITPTGALPGSTYPIIATSSYTEEVS